MVGQDHEIHIHHVDAASVFDAAYHAIQEWSRYWWWITDATLTVETGGNTWKVKSWRVMEWHAKKKGYGSPRRNR
jgi:hypothetical protein